MKPVLAAAAVALICSIPVGAHAQSYGERLGAAMKEARWTGPLLASTAETLPPGHFYTEPYFFDGISGGQHNPGSSGFYQYGLAGNWTVGMQPFFSLGTRRDNCGAAIGDFKLLSQVRLSHFTAEHRVPSVALVTNLIIPTGKHDRLGALKNGHGSGAFAPEIGVNVQQYFLLPNGRLLRGRINIFKDFPLRMHPLAVPAALAARCATAMTRCPTVDSGCEVTFCLGISVSTPSGTPRNAQIRSRVRAGWSTICR